MKKELFIASLSSEPIQVYFNFYGLKSPIEIVLLGLDNNPNNVFLYDEECHIMYEVVYKATDLFDGNFAYLVYRSI